MTIESPVPPVYPDPEGEEVGLLALVGGANPEELLLRAFLAPDLVKPEKAESSMDASR